MKAEKLRKATEKEQKFIIDEKHELIKKLLYISSNDERVNTDIFISVLINIFSGALATFLTPHLDDIKSLTIEFIEGLSDKISESFKYNLINEFKHNIKVFDEFKKTNKH